MLLSFHKLSLNRKQFLVAERIIQGALSWKDYPLYDRVKREQLLICIATEGGVGGLPIDQLKP
jgi:hypothetical protein